MGVIMVLELVGQVGVPVDRGRRGGVVAGSGAGAVYGAVYNAVFYPIVA